MPCPFVEHQCVLDSFYMSLAQQWQQFAEEIEQKSVCIDKSVISSTS